VSRPAIELAGLSKRFGDVTAVDAISLEVGAGELVSLLGPSGCGKTTTLSMVAGFLAPEAGDIRLHGQSVVGRPPNRRNCGMVFQSYALFPHMSVFENVAFGLRVRKESAGEIKSRVRDALAMVRLDGYAQRMPRQLSGGQRQRVSIARALVYRPQVLLLDEPFSNLDAKLRVAMRAELVEIQRQTGITALFVTHDQEEAMHISDRIVVMNNGRIAQIGSPTEVYRRPDTLFVADFLGEANLIEGRLAHADDTGGRFEGKNGPSVRVAGCARAAGSECWLMVRPEHIALVGGAGGSPGNRVEGEIRMHAFLGSHHIIEVESDGQNWKLQLPDTGGLSARPGDRVTIGWEPGDCVLLDA